MLFGTALSTIFLAAALTGLPSPVAAQVFWGPDDDYAASRRFESRRFEPGSFEQDRFERHKRRTARSKHRRDAEPVVKETSKPQGPLVIAVSIDEQRLRLYDANGLFAESPVSTGMRGHSTPMGVFSVIGKEKYHRSNIYSGAPMPYMQRITWSGVAMHAGVLPGYPASHGCIRMPMNFAIRMYGWTRPGARVVIAPNGLSPADFSHPLLFTHKPDPAPVAAAPADTTQASMVSAPKSTPKSDKATADSPAKTAESDKPELRTTQDAVSGVQIQTADASGAMPTKITDVAASPSDGKSIETTAVDETKDAAKQTVDPELKKDKDQTRQTAEDKPAEAPDAARSEAAKSDAAKSGSKTDKAAAATAPAKPRTGHIAAYVSRKEGKLFVRQNFEPLFETPVEIVDRNRPLGTHIFTMSADKDDAKTYRWSVISLPARNSADNIPRRKKGETTAQVPALPPSSPAEALDRVKIPDEAMQKIAEAIAPGGSIIVSDQGLGDETGLGTDFIVPLR
ncbi:MAG: L,D-transpeptidase [Bradyrhizobiaceae bacterium]|nr:MAG: L,D-transpeptidase [Bradyrhizobiaceae bacterium]